MLNKTNLPSFSGIMFFVVPSYTIRLGVVEFSIHRPASPGITTTHRATHEVMKR